jgi:hypothetical protein
MLCAQLCGARAGDGEAWRQVGTDYTNECELDALDLAWKAHEIRNTTLFYDLFYVDGIAPLDQSSDGNFLLQLKLSGTPNLYPVPVVVENVPDNAGTVNLVTRRFFSVDALLGTQTGSKLPTWIQYPESVKLVVQVMRTQSVVASATW